MQGSEDLLVVRRQRGNQTGEKPADEHHAHREQDDHAVDVNGVCAGNVMPRVNEPAKRDFREHQANRSSGDGEDEAFHDLFADETCAAAAKGGADGGLSAPRCRARDEKVGDIEAWRSAADIQWRQAWRRGRS